MEEAPGAHSDLPPVGAPRRVGARAAVDGLSDVPLGEGPVDERPAPEAPRGLDVTGTQSEPEAGSGLEPGTTPGAPPISRPPRAPSSPLAAADVASVVAVAPVVDNAGRPAAPAASGRPSAAVGGGSGGGTRGAPRVQVAPLGPRVPVVAEPLDPRGRRDGRGLDALLAVAIHRRAHGEGEWIGPVENRVQTERRGRAQKGRCATTGFGDSSAGPTSIGLVLQRTNEDVSPRA